MPLSKLGAYPRCVSNEPCNGKYPKQRPRPSQPNQQALCLTFQMHLCAVVNGCLGFVVLRHSHLSRVRCGPADQVEADLYSHWARRGRIRWNLSSSTRWDSVAASSSSSSQSISHDLIVINLTNRTSCWRLQEPLQALTTRCWMQETQCWLEPAHICSGVAWG